MYFLIIFFLCGTLIHQEVSCKATSSNSNADPDLTLNIFHVNDIHAHFEEVNVYTGRCREEMADNGECYGGVARMFTKLNELQNDPENQPWMFLNAGDYYQGTIWYTLFKWEPVAQFANYFNYTAMGLGNHEFDDGSDGIVPFAQEINFPLLAANIAETGESYLIDQVAKSTIVEREGKKIGIIGYVTERTSSISSADANMVFSNEIEAVRLEAQRLQSEEDIEILIALGHAGYEEVDLIMAKEIEEIDVVVGGHSHSFLYTGEQPSVETIKGPYPTYVTQVSGKVVPVVQAYCYTKYMGHFRLNFDADGDLMVPVDGAGVTKADVILLDSSIDKDSHIESLMEPWRELMVDYTTPLGETAVYLSETGEEESNLGNCIADGMVDSWEDTTIGFINNGGIRTNMIPGEITGEDIFNTLPFNSTVDRLTMTGENIKFVLEDYAEGLCSDASCYPGTFLQMAGIKVIYEVYEDNQWDRVVSMKVICEGEETIPIGQAAPTQLCDLDMEAEYKVAVVSFLANGGSRHNVRFSGQFSHQDVGMTDYDSFENYVIKNSPIMQMLEGRITMNYHPGQNAPGGPSVTDDPDVTEEPPAPAHASGKTASTTMVMILGVWMIAMH